MPRSSARRRRRRRRHVTRRAYSANRASHSSPFTSYEENRRFAFPSLLVRDLLLSRFFEVMPLDRFSSRKREATSSQATANVLCDACHTRGITTARRRQFRPRPPTRIFVREKTRITHRRYTTIHPSRASGAVQRCSLYRVFTVLPPIFFFSVAETHPYLRALIELGGRYFL